MARSRELSKVILESETRELDVQLLSGHDRCGG